MREDSIAAKANAAIAKSIRAMISNTMAQAEGRLPRAVGKDIHKGLVHEVAEMQALQEEARRQKQERLDVHYERLEAKEAQRKADRRARRKARAAPARA